MSGFASALAAALGAALGLGCASVEPFRCERDDQCGAGRCEAAGACSFEAAACRHGWRYGDEDPPGLAGLCVGDESGPIDRLAAGSDHTCARGADGRLWCWGDDRSGALGRVGDATDAPVEVPGVDAAAELDGGKSHTCAVIDAAAWCWGAGQRGQLGRGAAGDHAAPAPVVALAKVVDVELGAYASCALDRAGAVWCWGANSDGEMADDDPADHATPTRIDVPPTRVLAVGGQHACVITTAGAVWCWGKDASGQLGRGDGGGGGAAPPKPGVVDGFAGATALALGGEHSCARFDDGHVACTGGNGHGQLGDGTRKSRKLPAPVQGLDDAVEVVALDGATCARRASGAVVCWGEGAEGELGAGDADRLAPGEPVALARPATSLAAGAGHACALTDDGCAWCWGRDAQGQLGDGPGIHHGVRPVLIGACGGAAHR